MRLRQRQLICIKLLRLQSDIIHSAAQAINSRRADGTLLSWNQAAARIFGYTPEKAVGSHISLLYANAAPSDQSDLAQRAMQGEAVIDFQTKRRRKDGSEIDVEVTI